MSAGGEGAQGARFARPLIENLRYRALSGSEGDGGVAVGSGGRPAALLQTMPGIGLLVALTLLAELGDWRRFKGRAAVANYAGLVPVIRDSNHKHYAGGITHRGPSHLRAVLVPAAWVAIKRVPAYTELFERVARRRGRQVAVIAVARRMLEDAFTMLRKDEAFRFVPAAAQSRAETTACDPRVASSVAG